jgi:uncharacterized cupin superfamily protein
MAELPEGCTRLTTTGAGRELPRVEHDPTDTPIDGADEPRAFVAYRDATGKFTAGTWACNPGILEIRDLALDEVCFIIEGEVEVVDANGVSATFREGEAFVLHRGFSGLWKMPRTFRKFNGIFTAAEDG